MLGMLILFYSFMQLWEFFMWRAIENNDKELNIFASKLAYYTLYSHVFALGLGLYIQEPTLKNAMVLGAGVIYMIVAIVTRPAEWKESRPTADSKGHLVWGFPHSFYTYVYIGAIITMLFFTNWRITLPYLAFYTITLVFTMLTNKASIGSYWCWLTAFLAFVPVIMGCKGI